MSRAQHRCTHKPVGGAGVTWPARAVAGSLCCVRACYAHIHEGVTAQPHKGHTVVVHTDQACCGRALTALCRPCQKKSWFFGCAFVKKKSCCSQNRCWPSGTTASERSTRCAPLHSCAHGLHQCSRAEPRSMAGPQRVSSLRRWHLVTEADAHHSTLNPKDDKYWGEGSCEMRVPQAICSTRIVAWV